jgi:hypothetical protein
MEGFLFLLFVLLTLILVVGFIIGGRKNLKRAREVAQILEDLLKPEEKEYVWIGGYIGFQLNYELRGGMRVTGSFTTLPRHSLLYLPIAYLMKRGDSLRLNFLLGKRGKSLYDSLKKLSTVKSIFYFAETGILGVKLEVKKIERLRFDLEELLTYLR